MRYILILVILGFSNLQPSVGNADVVSTSFFGEVSADFDGTVATSNSTDMPGLLSETSSANNSFSSSNLDWTWDGTTLSGSSESIAEKTVSARPGGDHIVSASFDFTFTIDSDSTFELAGLWGTSGLNPNGDLLQYSITGPATFGPVSSTGTTGTSSELISNSGFLPVGEYTLSFDSLITETINDQGTANSGWTITSFVVTPVAVPEPTALATLLFSVLIFGSQTRKRTC